MFEINEDRIIARGEFYVITKGAKYRYLKEKIESEQARARSGSSNSAVAPRSEANEALTAV